MKEVPWIFALGLLLAMSATPPMAAGKSIVGTWRLVSMTYVDNSTGKEVDLWGKGPLGFLTYTSGGRMSAVIADASRHISKKSADQASLEEQAMLFRSSFAYAGTYSLTPTGVIHHVEVASDPTWVGRDQTRFVRFEGTRLVITGPPFQPVGEPNPQVLTLVWERVE